MSILTDAASKSLADFRNGYGQHLSPDAKAIIQGLASCGTTADLSTVLADAAEYLTAIRSTLESYMDPLSGRMRVFLDQNGGGQTLATVTTVGTVTNMSQVGAVPANSMVLDAMHATWAMAVRRTGSII